MPFFSTVTAEWLDTSSMTGEYRYQNLRRTVRLDESIRALSDQGYSTFVEVSPHPGLVVGIQETLEDATVVGTLRRNEGGLAAPHLPRRGVGQGRRGRLDARLRHRPGRSTCPLTPSSGAKFWPTYVPPRARLRPEEQTFWSAVESGDPAAVAAALDVQDADGHRGAGRHAAGCLVGLAASGSGTPTRSNDPRYQVTWKPLSSVREGFLTGTWLVVVAGDGAPEVVRGLRRPGHPDRHRRRWTGSPATNWPTGSPSRRRRGRFSSPSTGRASAGATVLLVQALGDAGIGAPLCVRHPGRRRHRPGRRRHFTCCRPSSRGSGAWSPRSTSSAGAACPDLLAVTGERDLDRVVSVLSGIGEE